MKLGSEEIRERVAKAMHPAWFEEQAGDLAAKYAAARRRDVIGFADKAVAEMREIVRDPIRDLLNAISKSGDPAGILDTREAGMVFKLMEDLK